VAEDNNHHTTEVKLAVMQEQLRVLIDDMKEARHARKNNYLAQEKRDELLLRIEHRLEKVESFMLGASPTLAEFNALKLKAQGAGAMGRFLWALAGLTIGAVASMSGWVHRIFEGIK
jgi:hypothetical protein